MPSKSIAPDPDFAHQSRARRGEGLPGLGAIWAGFLTLLVAAPWLGAGYIFGTDWPGPRHLDFPVDLRASAPLDSILAAIARVLSGELTGKLFVVALLFTAAWTAYRGVPASGFVPRAAAATIYVMNPFVFGRLHYGQPYLLAGYALLPWVAAQVRRLLTKPGLDSGVTAAASFVLLGIFSIHLFLIASVFATAIGVAYVIWAENKRGYLKRAGPAMLLAAGVSLVTSSYWIVPILMGRGPEGTIVAGVGPGDLNAYAAVPDPTLGLAPNLLGLYGFWAENTGRFTSMKAFIPYWPAVLGALLLIGVIGAVSTLRQGRSKLSPWVGGLLIASAIGLILEMGISQPMTAGLVRWLDANVVPYRGLRDAGKWAALLALVYSQLVALGAVAILRWLRRLVHDAHQAEWIGSVAAGLLLALPLYYGNGLLFGMHGEIKPSQYPPGWYAADRVLAADANPGRALVLPWHAYMSYSFIENQNKVVRPPAPAFFSIPVLVSANPEVPGIPAPHDPDQVVIRALVQAGGEGNWAEALKALNIKYVLLIREVDWASYRYLDDQAGLVKVGDYGSIVLYLNNSPRVI